MAQLHRHFDATQVDPGGTREPIPEGWYKVMITESEMKQNKARTGYYLELTMQVLEGPHAQRMLWDRLNLVNPNATAVEIAERTLSAICHSAGKAAVTDSVELHNIPIQAKAVIRPARGEYRASNEVDGYRKADGTEVKGNGNAAAAPAAPQAAPAPQAQPAPAASAPPWARSA